MIAEYIGTFLIVWISTTQGVALTTAGPMTESACEAGKITAQARASKTISVTAICIGD